MEFKFPVYDDGGIPGITWYQKLLSCEKSAWLSQKSLGSGYTVSPGLTIGTVGHAYAEMLYKQLPEFDGTIEFTDVPEVYSEENIDNGHIVGQRYLRDRHSLEFGEPISVEGRFALPESEYATLGQPYYIPFSGQRDLISRMSASDIERVRNEFGIILPRPGIYITDNKFFSRKSSDVVDEMATSIQLESYRRLAQIEYPNEEVVGAIANITYYYFSKTNNKNQYLVIPVLPSTEMDKVIKVFWERVARALDTINTLGHWPANYSGCFGKYGMCSFMKYGQCMRY